MPLPPSLGLFPHTAKINSQNHLVVGGCDTVELATSFGTPLYIFDETTLRNKCAEFRREFSQRYPDILIIYACKAFINRALALLLQEEGLGLDVVSAGELSIARSVDFPMNKVYFHGNNKSEEELTLALDWGVGRIVVDNSRELRLLAEIAVRRGVAPDILLRLSPGVDPHTHKYITTGIIDSKFGFPIISGQAEQALAQTRKTPSLNLTGLHCHIGSLIHETEPYRQAVHIMLRFAAEMAHKYGFELQELNIGGGFAVQYTLDTPVPLLIDYADAISAAVLEQARSFGLRLPRLVLEPGRAIVGQAGVALYKVGASKEVTGIRKYIFLDGGMADNIRPALYGAKYQALLANKARDKEKETVTLGGKFCESGDILIKDIALPPIAEGDIVAVPTCGAYCLSLASNYNASLKPPIVLVKNGEARLIRRGETYEDLIRFDLLS